MLPAGQNTRSASISVVEPWEIENLRRSIVMTSGSTVGPLTKDAALALIEEVQTSRQETARYRQVVAQLRGLLDTIDE